MVIKNNIKRFREMIELRTNMLTKLQQKADKSKAEVDKEIERYRVEYESNPLPTHFYELWDCYRDLNLLLLEFTKISEEIFTEIENWDIPEEPPSHDYDGLRVKYGTYDEWLKKFTPEEQKEIDDTVWKKVNNSKPKSSLVKMHILRLFATKPIESNTKEEVIKRINQLNI